jgi:hypothetical protein
MKYKILPIILILLFGLFVTSVLAEDEHSIEVRRTPDASRSALLLEKSEDRDKNENDKNENDKNSSSEGKLKSCQSKEKSVKKRLDQLIKLVVKMEGKFDAITLRIQNFYTTKVVPGGKTIPNYDALVADIATKKASVQTALSNVQNGSTNFSCTAEDPKGQLNKFKLEMQNVKKTLHDYRTSIKNLIIAIHTLVGDAEESPEPDETHKPKSTPTVTPIPSVTPDATPTI